MKKFLIFCLSVILAAGFCSSCGAESGAAGDSDDKISVVATIFPEYDWVKSILGDNPGQVDVTLLLDSGVDLHSYQPTADDILKIADCDLFIYVGGESDEWVDDVLAQATNKNMKVIDFLDVLGDSVREEELVEGMEEEHEDEHGDDEEEEGPEYDEHVWLSLRSTEVLCREIADALGTLDPDNKDTYDANVKAYIEELEELDGQYADAVKDAKVKTLVFGDRFPFRYLVDDYGLDYYAAFAGCSAESEASFETITFLARKVDELKLNYVMTIEGTDHSIAETIVKNTEAKDQQILTLDSMQSTTSASEDHYIDIMKSNLEVLKQALQN